jgi:hypothetical protein
MDCYHFSLVSTHRERERERERGRGREGESKHVVCTSLCGHHNLYQGITIFIRVPQFLSGYHNLFVGNTISMWVTRSLCGYHILYQGTTISMRLPQSLCGYHDLYEYLDFYDGGRVCGVLRIFRPALVRPLVLHLDVLDLDQRLKTFFLRN